jgi:hypothetical protein
VSAVSPESFRIGDYLAQTLVIEMEKAKAEEAAQAVDLSHPTEGLERLSEITGMDVGESLDFGTSDDALDAATSESQRLAPEPHLTLALPEEANREAVDDAYWSFMNRFSEDVVRELSPEELDQRCRELTARFQHLDMAQLGVRVEYSRRLSDRHKREFIHQHVLAVNKARDALLS